jgi:hypothetical protein
MKDPDDGRIRVYRHRNERFSSSCVQEVDSFGGCSVMMWAAISNDRKTDLVHVPEKLPAVRYRDEFSNLLIDRLRWRLSLAHRFIQLIP